MYNVILLRFITNSNHCCDDAMLIYGHLSHLMRLWYFSSSVSSFFKRACVAIRARCLIFCQTLRLLPYFMCANSEGSCETARMRRVAWAFAGRICDTYHNLMSWLILTFILLGSSCLWRVRYQFNSVKIAKLLLNTTCSCTRTLWFCITCI